MYEETYAQREKRKKNEKRVTRTAKIIVLIILATPLLVIGFFIGRMTAPTEQPLQETREYSPDPCGLDVVVCEGETN